MITARTLLIIALLFSFVLPIRVRAIVSPLPSATATASAIATESATPAVVQKKQEDITQTVGQTKGRLEQFLDSNPIGPLTWSNPLQVGIRQAVSKGVPANTIVLLLLFPVVTFIIAFFRHILGFRGFGIYSPAVLSVAFVATGLRVGVLLFFLVIVSATVSRRLMKVLRLQYLPRISLLIGLVTLAVLLAMILPPQWNISIFNSLNIFPILILILLAENFIEVQMNKSQREAIELTVETAILALLCASLIRLEMLQQLVLLYPEAEILTIAALNLFIGRYTGLRLLEYLRFRAFGQ